MFLSAVQILSGFVKKTLLSQIYLSVQYLSGFEKVVKFKILKGKRPLKVYAVYTVLDVNYTVLYETYTVLFVAVHVTLIMVYPM